MLVTKIYLTVQFGIVQMAMQLIVMGSCRKVFKVDDCEVLDNRQAQGAFTICLTVKALRECHTLNLVITRRIKVFVIGRPLNSNSPNTYTIKLKVHKVHYILSVNKLSFVSALLKMAPLFFIVHRLPHKR